MQEFCGVCGNFTQRWLVIFGYNALSKNKGVDFIGAVGLGTRRALPTAQIYAMIWQCNAVGTT